MDQDTILGLVRHALTSAGGYLVADGLATSSQVSDAAGAIVILIGLAWSIWNKRQHAAAIKVALATPVPVKS
jgi:hypothetical protein